MKRIDTISNQWYHAIRFVNARCYTALISLASYTNVEPAIIAVSGYLNGTAKKLKFGLVIGNSDIISQIKYKIVDGSYVDIWINTIGGYTTLSILPLGVTEPSYTPYVETPPADATTATLTT